MTKYIKTYLTLITLSLAISVQGQIYMHSDENGLFNFKNAHFNRKQGAKHFTPKSPTPVIEELVQTDPADTMSVALYRSHTKQYGWARGLGKPITNKEAEHQTSYYRFSNKNKAGHWTKMECFDGYGNPLTCGNTYLINPYDDDDKQIDGEWCDKLKKIVYWEFIGDQTGEHCVQENAYDKEGNLVLSYFPVRVGENKYMGHYVDAWGLPAKMRYEQGAKYVLIQWDDYGYESDVSFIGNDGFYKKNNWGAYRSKYIHDKNGHLILHMSANVDGSYMIDRAGNSGQYNTFDENGFMTSTTNRNTLNQDMRIELGESATEDYFRKNYEYDEWGLESEYRFFLADGITPDTTSYGLHGCRYEYNDHGKWTLIQYFGLNGEPVNNYNGASTIKRQFDEKGNELSYECYDAKGNRKNNNLCLVYYSYDSEDNLIDKKNYVTTTGKDTVLTYHFYRKDNKRIYVYPQDDWINIDTYDEFGDLTEEVYTHLDGSARYNFKGYHRMTQVYTRNKNKRTCKIEKCYWDINNKLVDIRDSLFSKQVSDYNRHITISDTINQTSIFQRFNGKKLLSQFKRQLANGFDKRLSENGLDIMGHQARSHYTNGLYYDNNISNTIKSGFSTSYTSATNEYGEISYYITSDRIEPYVYAFEAKGVWDYYDENGSKIEVKNMSAFRKNLPITFIIEVYDSIAQKHNLQSGDVIMQYGDWEYPMLMKGERGDSIEKSLRKTTFLLKNNKKNIVVMRRNPLTNQPEVKVIELDKGTLGDYGVYFHRIYCTKKEEDRYNNTYTSWSQSIRPLRKTKTYKEEEETVFMRPYRSYGNKNNIYSQNVVDDAIILGLLMEDSKGNIKLYHHRDKIELFDSCLTDNNSKLQKIWLTTDMHTVRSIEIGGKQNWDAYFWSSNVDKRIYKPCKPLYAYANKQMENYAIQLKQAYSDSLMNKYGYAWKAVENDSVTINIASVDGEEGYLIEKGFKGTYVILEWCGWSCTDSYRDYNETYEANRLKNKKATLLQVIIDNDVEVYGDIYKITSDKPLLGVTINTKKISYNNFKKNILDRYQKWVKEGDIHSRSLTQ